MSALEALVAAWAGGAYVDVEGDDLVLSSDVVQPSELLDRLRQHKPDILSLVRLSGSSWTPTDWQVLFDERAAIAEYDGGLPRSEAEALAASELGENINVHRISYVRGT